MQSQYMRFHSHPIQNHSNYIGHRERKSVKIMSAVCSFSAVNVTAASVNHSWSAVNLYSWNITSFKSIWRNMQIHFYLHLRDCTLTKYARKLTKLILLHLVNFSKGSIWAGWHCSHSNHLPSFVEWSNVLEMFNKFFDHPLLDFFFFLMLDFSTLCIFHRFAWGLHAVSSTSIGGPINGYTWELKAFRWKDLLRICDYLTWKRVRRC